MRQLEAINPPTVGGRGFRLVVLTSDRFWASYPHDPSIRTGSKRPSSTTARVPKWTKGYTGQDPGQAAQAQGIDLHVFKPYTPILDRQSEP